MSSDAHEARAIECVAEDLLRALMDPASGSDSSIRGARGRTKVVNKKERRRTVACVFADDPFVTCHDRVDLHPQVPYKAEVLTGR
jgi:hypothetical protein